MATTPVPSKIGKYDVIGVIGRGGMGVVYQAMDPHLDRKVAIKMITGAFSENPDMLKRFFREAQSLGSLQHPNIVTVFDLGDYGGNPYFVMEYLEGEGLDAVMSNHRPLNLLEKIAIIIQVCSGLGYAHRRGVIHRDIKPANIMINKDGAIKIFDFGIAHAGQMHVTRTGEILGTLRYMAPEQINGKTVDSRTDIFSLGVVFYQLITDHLPFDGDNTATTLLKIVNDQPPPLSSFLQSFPPELEQILLKALAKSPDERYGTADDFALDLGQLQGQLKEELIGQEMSEAALLIEQGEVYKAQGTLLRVLKIDQQHTRANRLLREVQQRIQRDEIGKQVCGLRERAEEALADQQFDRALEHVDRALALDRDNLDLIQLREQIRNAAAHAEKLQKALKVADAAHADGKLEEAKEAVEGALAIAPNDTQARTLYRLIGRELEERTRQRQMEGYLLEARQELSSRRFTAALVILKMAEELDPSAPQVHSLKESAVASQEQESRRRELEALTHEVEEALNRDDYQSAYQKANEGLVRFPDDRNLLRLKALADRQRQIEERKHLVDTIMVESRVLLQEGRHDELRDKLEKALAQLGPEARLQSLLGVVSERLVREQAERLRSESLQQARQFFNDRAFEDAIQTLEAQAKDTGDDQEVQDFLGRVRSEQAELVQGALLRAEQEAVLDVRVDILEEALRMSPRDGRVKEQLHQARNLNQVISKIVSDAKRLEAERQYDQALAKWETISAVYQHFPDLKTIIKKTRELRDQALTSAKQNWITRIENALGVSDFDQAMALLGQATQAFPWDNDLMAQQDRAENGARQRAKAQKLLAEGRKAFANQQWDAGSQLMLRACQTAPQDAVIREQAVGELQQASRATLDRNWQASELMLRRLSEIEADATGAQDLQATIQERKREEAIANAEQREQEIRQREAKEKQAHEQEEQMREMREQERLAREQRAKEQDEERRRAEAHAAEARSLEQARAKSAPVAPAEQEDLSATRIFSLGSKPDASATASPAVPPSLIPAAPPSAKQELPPAASTASPDTLHSQRTLSLVDGLTTKVRQALRDSTLFSKTPASDAHIPEVGPPISSDELQPAFLPVVERQLAVYIGPLAKVLVKRAAAKTTSVLELYTMLTANIEKESDRQAFLARSAELVGSKASGAFTKLATPPVAPSGPAPLNVASLEEMTPAVVEQVAKRLAAHLGPIAPIVARKEAKRATNMREFYALLAEHIVSPTDRERFLKESGVVKEAPATGLLTLRNEITSINARPGSSNAPTAQFKPDRKPE